MTERELLVDCLRRLNRAAFPYMLTGSMASNYWGIPRTTHDIDFVIRIFRGQASAMADVFRNDFYVEELSIEAAFAPPFQFNVIDSRSALKVDFWLLRDEPFEQEMFGRRIRTDLFGEEAWLCTAEDVILHKLYWDAISPSERQRGDAAGVVAVQGPALDRSYLERWAARLKVSAKLADLLAGRIRPKVT